MPPELSYLRADSLELVRVCLEVRVFVVVVVVVVVIGKRSTPGIRVIQHASVVLFPYSV